MSTTENDKRHGMCGMINDVELKFIEMLGKTISVCMNNILYNETVCMFLYYIIQSQCEDKLVSSFPWILRQKISRMDLHTELRVFQKL